MNYEQMLFKFVCVCARRVVAARPLRDSARAVLEWRAARTGHGYRVEDKSPVAAAAACRPANPPSSKPSSPAARLLTHMKTYYTTYNQPILIARFIAVSTFCNDWIMRL